MTYSYIIIEDNPGAIKNLQLALKPHAEFKSKGYAINLSEGLALYYSQNPQIVFLDVELGDQNGFEIIKEIRRHSKEMPYFIMITDFDKYAKEAVNKDAIYFLDKPVDPDELVVALNKVKRRMVDVQNQISIKNTEGHFFIDTDSICYVEADSNVCRFLFDSGESQLVTKTMKKIEALLPNNFIRIHKSYIINKNRVKMLNTTSRILRLEYLGEQKEIPIGASYLKKVRVGFLGG